MSVIAYHLNAAWLPGGFTGVDVFFVISGFVVSSSVSGLQRMNVPNFMLYFYARRLVRITPALIVCLLATSLASALFVPDAWLSHSNQDTGLFAYLGLSNFVLAKNVGNYFSPSAESNPFTHTWSLAVEEQFYVAFPPLFVAWLFAKRHISIAFFATCAGISFFTAVWLAHTDEAQAFYMIWGRFWELGAGVLLFQSMAASAHPFNKPSPYRPSLALGAILSAIVLATGFVLARPESAPFPACILPVLGTVGLLGCIHGRDGGIVHRLLNLRLLRFIGKISYSLYLWHWPVFVLFRWTVGLESILCRLAALCLAVILSIASFYFVETPPRRVARRFHRAIVILSGLLLVGSGYWISSQIATHQPTISLSTVARHADMWYPGSVSAQSTHPSCRNETQARDVSGGALWVYSRTGCSDLNVFPHRVFVIGDSHAMVYLPMFSQFVMNTGATVYAYSNGGCAFINLLPRSNDAPDQCDGYGAAAVADILPLIRPGDVVFLPSLRLPHLADQFAIHDKDEALATILSPQAAAGRVDGEARAIPILREMSNRGARIVFEGPTPVLQAAPFRCSDWFNRENPVCKNSAAIARSFIDKLRAPVLKSYANIANEVPNVTVWDPVPMLCTASICPSQISGSPLYFDGDHLSGYASKYLLRSFSDFIETQGGT